MKKLLALLVPLAPVVALAEGTTPALDVTGVTDMATSMQTGFTSMATALGPIVIAVILVGVGIWLVPKAVGIIKTALQAGKGR